VSDVFKALSLVNPKAYAALLRFAKSFALGAAFLAVDGAVTLLSSNALGIAPTYQSLVMAIAVPLLLAGEKWITWAQSQPYGVVQQGINAK
jgi:hypothetical protein